MLEKKNTLKVDSNLDLYSEASKGCNSLYNISNFWYNSWIPVNNMSYFHIDYKICEQSIIYPYYLATNLSLFKVLNNTDLRKEILYYQKVYIIDVLFGNGATHTVTTVT